jgi:succinate-acetate transporter protein
MALHIDRTPAGVEEDPMEMAVVARNGNGDRPAPAIADPAPLGLIALALTTLVFSLFNAGLLDRTGEPVLFGLAAIYGGLVQLLAGMWEFRRGNTFGAVTFGSYGAFWLSLWAFDQFLQHRIPAGDVANVLAMLYIVWAVFSASLWVASTRTTAAVSVMLALLTIGLALLGIGYAGAHTELIKIGGWFGLATAVAAWYAGFAGLINSTYRRTVLPLVPLGRTR